MKSIRRICALLERAYGRRECKPRRGPLDELVLTILSQNTTSANSSRAFANLCTRFQSWDEVGSADVSEIEEAVRVGGLGIIKARRIKKLLGEIRAQRGKLGLDFLTDMPDDDARAFLMQFEGVGVKTASCVLMFSLCRPVFPVDTHVYRVAQRLGLISSHSSVEAAHHVLQEMIPGELMYSLHINLVTHGRRVCKARNPACDVCVLLPACPWRERVLASRGA
ncbi:MAG TPA: endonuclease III [Armatimonadota bacterium]|nr:endonuclease III [Armatimonadota bacterium]